MQMANGDQAVVDIAKLRDYCLNPDHRVGRFKARVFAAALGLTAADAPLVATWLVDAARHEDAQTGRKDSYGQRYTVDFSAKHRGHAARVRSCWIVLTAEDFPRLVTCYVI